ncbi:MAG: right-handed parallel beta-helix repeat-containing protein [Candidatus Coatesbacteria bacterium]|nr:right-handed parallel beta-helix repeat-containing protein [Candidatus Coatesbacteria bacterium]
MGGRSARITDNLISENSAYWYGGGISCDMHSSPRISGNIILANSASSGGGIHFDGRSPSILNNVIAECHASHDGAGIYGESGTFDAMNNTIVFNEARNEGGGIYCEDDCHPEIVDCIIWNTWGSSDDLNGCTATYCCIQDRDSGEGNIHLNPLLVPGPLGSYYLAPDSPCIYAGSQSAEEADLSNLTTQADSTPDTGTVDMGYHYPIPE